MAKITRSLDDIEKLVKKAHQTPKEQLREVQEQLKQFDLKTNLNSLYYVGKDALKNEDLQRVKTLKEAEKILLEEIEKEENKKELDQIKLNERLEKQLKKEIKEQLFEDINGNFKEFSTDKHKLIYQVLHEPEAIEEAAARITKIYGNGFYDYVLSIYIKTLEEVYRLYKFNIDLQEKQCKEAQQRINQRLKRGIAHDLAVIGILKLANKKKNYRR